MLQLTIRVPIKQKQALDLSNPVFDKTLEIDKSYLEELAPDDLDQTLKIDMSEIELSNFDN